MAFRTIWTSSALAIVVKLPALSGVPSAAPMTASAQGGRGGQQPPYTPAAGAKDLRAVLFNWTSYMGMLRGLDEHELITTLEYQGNGTMQVDGQPCTIKKYRVSINYQLPGQRTQITCARAGGQTYTNVEVVNGQYAWNESVSGAEIAGTKGTVTPMAAAVQERLIRIWASPQGAPKAALLGVNPTVEWGANPSVGIKDGTTTQGQTSLTWEGNKPVLTFPIPGVPGATATATLDAKYMAERVVVKHAGGTTEFVYSGYKDWNNKLNLIDTMYAGKIDGTAEQRGGSRSDDCRNGNRQRLCRHAGAREREEGNHADSTSAAREADAGAGTRTRRTTGTGASGRRADSAPGRRETGSVG